MSNLTFSIWYIDDAKNTTLQINCEKIEPLMISDRMSKMLDKWCAKWNWVLPSKSNSIPFWHSLHNFNVKHDWITDLLTNLFGYVHICFDICLHFVIDFDEDALEICTTGINVIAAAQKVHHHGRYGQNVGVSAIDLHQPLNEETGNGVVIDKWNQELVWQKIRCRIPIADVHVVAGIHRSHSERTATDIDEHKIC